MSRHEYPTSQSLYDTAVTLMPGGVSSPVRAFRSVGGTPVFIAAGEGPYVIDVEGNRYIDLVMSWGAIILGHAHPRVVAAAERAVRRGSSFGMPTPGEVDLAERITGAFPFVDRVRFVNSGTEATMSAVRLARAATNRDRILKFEGCYHGHADAFLVQAGSGALTFGHPSSPGVPGDVGRLTLVAPYQDTDAVTALFDRYGDSIAAVIVEPVAGNMGLIEPDRAFLQFLRDITRRAGALLIFDEVITGFRTAWGGWSNRVGITPDLITLGKVIGGGFPLAAYAGPEHLMKQIAPDGPVYQAGTLAGNPVAVAAGLAVLDTIAGDPEFYATLEARTRSFAERLKNLFESHDQPAQVHAVPGVLGVFFTDRTVRNLGDVKAAEPEPFRRLFHGLLKRGVHLPPSPFEGWFLSITHDDDILDEILHRLDETLKEIHT